MGKVENDLGCGLSLSYEAGFGELRSPYSFTTSMETWGSERASQKGSKINSAIEKLLLCWGEAHE